MNYSEAVKLALNYIEESEISLKITCEGECAAGWYFCYDSEDYIRTGNPSSQLAGNGPILIDKRSGELHVFGTDKPLQNYLDEYISSRGG
ncbi:YrhB family protein [Xanthomonas cucurbitae]|nr:YrhB family protein [Xanthomonas cucurbitae]WDM81428.1 YrhB family protein [Xanthomonas cucurbitae]